MEITYFFNIPLTTWGVLFMKNLYQRGYVEYSYLTAYVCSSIVTLMHYRIENPSSFLASVNFSISGEGIAIFAFIIASFTIKQQPGNRYYKVAIILFPIIAVSLLILNNMGLVLALVALVLFSMVCQRSRMGINDIFT